MKVRPIPDEDPLPDGVYLGLPEVRYFAQPLRRGTSDWGRLWTRKEGWWWSSPHNPFFKPVARDPQNFGSALHCYLLEGPVAFAERYAVQPDPRQYPQLLTTADDLRSALRASSAPTFSARTSKGDLVELAKAYLPGRHIWDSIMDRFRRVAGDRPQISAEERWHLDVMREAAAQDERMRVVLDFAGGVRLVEVSVFWTLADGTRMRFRFDSLLPSLGADLKSIDNYRNEVLADAVGKRIGHDALDVQAALGFEARRQLYRLVEAGAVFGGTQDEVDWLARFPTEAPLRTATGPGWNWLWAFYQKPSNDGRAPAIMPVFLRFGSLEHRDGYRKAAHALAFYRDRLARFGLDTPWTAVAPLHHFDVASRDNQIRAPSWVEQPLPVADEEEAMRWQE